MYTSQQIAAMTGAFPGSNMNQPQQLPTLYGQGAQPGWNHGSQDQYGYGFSNKAAGMAVGIAGPTMMGGVVGGIMAFNAFTKGPWGGIKRAMSSNQAFQAARGSMAQATTMSARFAAGGRMMGAMGGMTGRVAFGAAMGGLPYYLGYKALSGVGNAIYSGARFQQDANRVMSRHLTFQSGSNSRTGFGLSEREMTGVTRMVGSMAKSDTLRSKDELMRVMDKLGRRDFFQDVSNVNQFKKKFKGMVKTLTHMAKTFGTSLEEAVPLLDSMRRSGIYTSQAQKSTALRMRTAGLDPRNATAVMSAAANMGRSSGGHGGAAAQGALNTLRTLKFAQQMGGGVGTKISNLMSEMSGGLQGAQARGAVTKQLTAQTLRFLRGGLGRASLAALANKDFSGLDKSKVEMLMQGKLSTSQLMSMGMRNTASMRNKARFINREGDLRTAFLKQAGPMGMMGMVQSTMRSGIIRGASDSDIKEIITKRLAGGNRRTAQLLLNMAKNMPKLRADMNRADIRQLYQRSYGTQYRDKYSYASMKKRLGNRLYNTFAEPFAQGGGSLYNSMTRAFRGIADDAMGRVQVTTTASAAKAALGYDPSNKKSVSEFNKRFGTGDSLTGTVDMQRRKYGGLIRSVASTLGGFSVPDDAGTQIFKSFSREQLQNMGGFRGTVQQASKNKRAILYRMNKINGRRQLVTSDGNASSSTRTMMMSNTNLRKFLRLERDRASGKRAAQIAKKYGKNFENKTGLAHAAFTMKNKVLMDTSFMQRYRAADPGQQRHMLRDKMRKEMKKNKMFGNVVNKVANDMHGGSGKGAIDNALDDMVSVAETQLQKAGIDKISRNVSGSSENLFNAAKDAKSGLQDSLSEVGRIGIKHSISGFFRFYTSFGGTKEEEFMKSDKLFRSQNKVSDAIMAYATKGRKLTGADKNIIAALQAHQGGDKTIGGQKLTNDQITSIRGILSQGRARGGASKGTYNKWRKSIQKQNAVSVATQLREFGSAGLSQMKGLTGAPSGAIRTMLSDMSNVTSYKQLTSVLSGKRFGAAAKSFAGMSTKERSAYLSRLSGKGSIGTAISAALKTYVGKKGNEKNLDAAKKVLLSRTVSAGSAAAGSAPGSLGGTMKLWTEYIRANQKFITAVAAALSDKDLAKIAKNMPKRSTSTG